MSVSKVIRLRSLSFLNELIKIFNLQLDFVINDHTQSFARVLQSNNSTLISISICKLSKMFSEIFPQQSRSFIWEALRSFSSSKDKPSQILIKPYTWIIMLISPWCHLINMADMESEIVNAQFYKFLVDNSLDKHETIFDCWDKVIRSTLYGIGNAAVLLETLVHVHSRLPKYRAQCIFLTGHIMTIYPEMVSSILSLNLSAAGKAWKKSNLVSLDCHKSHSVIKQYINKVALSIADDTSDWLTYSQSSLLFISEIILVNYEAFLPNLHILLNYSLCNYFLR
jgi:hypothetical protein